MARLGATRHGRALFAGFAIAAALVGPVTTAPALAAEDRGGTAPARGVPPAQAPDDGLSLVSASTYTLDSEKSVVHVSVSVTAENTKPNLVRQTPTGTLTTRYFFESASIAVQPEATSVGASAAKTQLTTALAPDEGFAHLRIDFPKDLYFGESIAFTVGWDLPGGAARSESDIRVGSAFATFPAWAFGDRGDVEILVPNGYDVETSGSPTQESAAGGVTTISATGIDDTAEWYALVVADRHDALTQDRLDLADGEHLVIRAWPEDDEWRTRVSGLLDVGLPALVAKLGLAWPVEGDIEVVEVHTPLLEGYGGVFLTDEHRIEISEDLDELTIVHEASHAWFNADLFVGRWIDEGLADEYASRVLDDVSNGGLRPESVARTDSGAVGLNDWAHPGRIADAETEARETYGYNAAWTAMRAIVAATGEEAMRDVLAAGRKRETAYVGAEPVETLPTAADWRRFLDLLEERGHAAGVEPIFRRWVVNADEAALLDDRSAARAAYAELLEEGDGWRPAWAVREPLGRWAFPTAKAAIDAAERVLETRDAIDAAAAKLDVEPPASLRTAYEGERSDIASVQALADRQLAMTAGLAEARSRVAADRPPLTILGLLGSDPDRELATAGSAFSEGDLEAADADLAEIDEAFDAAVERGRERMAAGGIAGAGLVAIGGAAFFAARRGRRRLVARRAELTPARGSAPLQPYATLGDPRLAAAPEPADVQRDEGEGT
ncbi:MAG: hypothetical protein ACJ77F_02710 [Chloroflexota bacterium]